jgi:hypothetical protein
MELEAVHLRPGLFVVMFVSVRECQLIAIAVYSCWRTCNMFLVPTVLLFAERMNPELLVVCGPW